MARYVRFRPATHLHPVLASLLAALALLLATEPAPAALIVGFQPASVTAAPGSTGNVLTVTLTNDGNAPTGPFSLAGFNVTLEAGPAVTFTGGDANVPNYLLQGNSVGFGFTNPGGPHTADISDFADDLMAPIPANSSFNLGRVFFDVASSAAVGSNLGINVNTTASGFTDSSFGSIPFSAAAAQVTVVPEPTSLVLWGTIAAGAACGRRRWRRRQAA